MRKRVLWNFFAGLVVPLTANAAGTYYTGAAYQPAQYRYGQTGTYATSGYGRAATNTMPSVRYNGYGQTMGSGAYQTQNSSQMSTSRTTQSQSSQKAGSSKNGFFIGGGLSHETAMWKIDMTKESNSMLHYDNVAWNVLDINGGYIFDLGNTKMQVDAGFKYGMQWGDTSMIDDDISNGGFEIKKLVRPDGTVIGTELGHALSVGTSSDGNMLGFNVGFGLTDFFKIGNLKITPSIGYRYFKHKLSTKKNYGMMLDTLNSSGLCTSNGGETQCDPLLVLFDYDATLSQENRVILGRNEYTHQVTIDGKQYSYKYYLMEIPNNPPQYLDTGGTYYYEQSGTSHSYETEWSGPYVAVDVVYDINQYNSVDGRVELGFPGYKSVGDQPYRPDWQHPKSVEDSAGMFSAFHFGFLANWKTAITNSLWLSLGLTYDWYSVSGADASTYLNGVYYENLYNQRLITWLGANSSYTEDHMLNGVTESGKTGDQASDADPLVVNPDATALDILNTLNSCSNWVCKSSKEIDSVYKSMGIRVGIDARF